MSATDEQHERLGKGYPHTLRLELHKALMARGIDYWVAQGLTFWNCPDGRECVAYGYQSNGKPRLAVKIVGITDPEQAIAVTVGAGTCEADETETIYCVGNSILLDSRPLQVHVMECTECGHTYEHVNGDYEYCPRCGRKRRDFVE